MDFSIFFFRNGKIYDLKISVQGSKVPGLQGYRVPGLQGSPVCLGGFVGNDFFFLNPVMWIFFQ